jgi:glycosyltransferase involved in cell wall biosynthesis
MNIAVLIPCFNEALSINRVISDFKHYLPGAKIYVYDNNSNDNTAEVARLAGAIVRTETRQGKGYVVSRMFGDIEADIYFLIDGDGTYDVSAAPLFIQPLIDDAYDFVNGLRVESDIKNYRHGHRFGNYMLTTLVAYIFDHRFKDMLSGYKIFTRKFVKSFPHSSSGFEIETQLIVHALQMGIPATELPVKYINRVEGSESKLNTYRDGFRILLTIFRLFIQEKPMIFFGALSLTNLLFISFLFIPILNTYLETGLVPRYPTLIAIVGLGIACLLCLLTGFISSSISITRKEMRRLSYLAS